MQELVTRAQADVLFTILPILGLIGGIVAGLLARRGGQNALAAAVLWGGPPVLIGILWRVYNAITDRIGLDRVTNLAVNFGLFIVVGILCGIIGAALGARGDRGEITPAKDETLEV
jgi:hypothetical protein